VQRTIFCDCVEYEVVRERTQVLDGWLREVYDSIFSDSVGLGQIVLQLLPQRWVSMEYPFCLPSF
jgi:hypothetical protein